jgi:hypothetical protein
MSTVNGAEISVATANEYIERYLANYFTPGKTPVKSMIIDAQMLRNYLSNPDIQNVKFVLGAMDYVHQGVTTEVFTLIVAGYDAAGNYILTPNGLVIDQTKPCPPDCPPIGNAGNDFIS